MIKELVNFTKNLDEDFKNLAIKPREGLHIMLQIVKNEDNIIKLDLTPTEYEVYSKKMVEESAFITKCKFLTNNAWCIDTNKCFDLPTKAIHSCSPLLVAFKREHLEGGEKFIANTEKNKSQISERFDSYFGKAFELLENEGEKQRYTLFKNFFVSKDFEKVLAKIQTDLNDKQTVLKQDFDDLLQLQKDEADKIKKEELKIQIRNIEGELLKVKQIDDSEYLLFYLDEPLETYVKPHSKYLGDKLFNTDKFNTEPDDRGLIYGTSNFMNSFNSNMPFLTHQTALFSITGRISNSESKYLSQLLHVLAGKILPNPLPIFVFKEELQAKSIGLFKDSGFKIGYKEIIENLLEDYKDDLGNYYLLNWVNSTDGIVFRDFDFVSKFEYEYKIEIQDLFQVDYKPQLITIFDFQNEILPVIFNNNFIVRTKDGGVIQKYFDDIDSKYCKSALNQILILKYRKAFYEFIYKSSRSSLTQNMFNDILSSSILEDIRLDNVKNNSHTEYFNIRKKLNIWFSLYENFNQNNTNEKSMASKLNDYQEFVDKVVAETADFSNATDEQFMFITGQVIDYLLSKSKSADKSYQLLEPYTQKSSCKELQKAVANDFARYKHANYSGNFEKAASFVLTYETDKNLKNYLPELLAGVFAKNQLFATKKESITV